jgi:putative membrane protein
MLTDTDRQRIAAAVKAAELGSAGEIVTIVTPQSDSYRDVALAWSISIAFLALAALELAPTFYLGLIERLLGLWAHEWTPRAVLGIALTVAVIKFLAMLLLMAWQPLRLLLTPAPIKSARVHARALTCFRIGAEGRTTGRTGILIYLSLAEHRAEIIADEAIASKVAPEVWGDAMHALLGPIRAGQVGEGMVAAIGKVGEVLAQHLPRAADDENELPDRVIEV